jgi:hypothetical protein
LEWIGVEHDLDLASDWSTPLAVDPGRCTGVEYGYASLLVRSGQRLSRCQGRIAAGIIASQARTRRAVPSARRGRVKMLDVVTIVFFIGLAIAGVVVGARDGDVIDTYSNTISSGVLGLMALGSLVFVPFTEQYARESTPPEVWHLRLPADQQNADAGLGARVPRYRGPRLHRGAAARNQRLDQLGGTDRADDGGGQVHPLVSRARARRPGMRSAPVGAVNSAPPRSPVQLVPVGAGSRHIGQKGGPPGRCRSSINLNPYRS